jgi:hypothetical protein
MDRFDGQVLAYCLMGMLTPTENPRWVKVRSARTAPEPTLVLQGRQHKTCGVKKPEPSRSRLLGARERPLGDLKIDHPLSLFS